MTRQFYKLPFCGHTGGDIWAQAKAEVEKAKAEGREPSPVDLSIAQANDGKGYGWNWLIVDNSEVDDDNRNLQYGVIIGPKVGEGYSVCDIILERVGDLEE